MSTITQSFTHFRPCIPFYWKFTSVKGESIRAQEIGNSPYATSYKSQRLQKSTIVCCRTNSLFMQLAPFLHNDLIRVGGTLKKSSLSFAAKHSILLPSLHPFVHTITNYFNILRDQFWNINARNTIKQVIHKCIMCYRCRSITENQVMGELPVKRVKPTFPFEISGVVYCGPLHFT